MLSVHDIVITGHQWHHQGDAYGLICTQSIHQYTLYCDVYLVHVHVLEAVLFTTSPQPAAGMCAST